jgi:hypothetical protein
VPFARPVIFYPFILTANVGAGISFNLVVIAMYLASFSVLDSSELPSTCVKSAVAVYPALMLAFILFTIVDVLLFFGCITIDVDALPAPGSILTADILVNGV